MSDSTAFLPLGHPTVRQCHAFRKEAHPAMHPCPARCILERDLCCHGKGNTGLDSALGEPSAQQVGGCERREGESGRQSWGGIRSRGGTDQGSKGRGEARGRGGVRRSGAESVSRVMSNWRSGVSEKVVTQWDQSQREKSQCLSGAE